MSLTYVLEKWGFRMHEQNRKRLATILDNFKADDRYMPHNRVNFYRYYDERNFGHLFEKSEGERQ